MDQMPEDTADVHDKASANEINKDFCGKLAACESVAGSVYTVTVATVTRSVDNNNEEDCDRSCNKNSLDAVTHFGKAGLDVKIHFNKANRYGSDARVSGKAFLKKSLDTGLSQGYRLSIVNESWRQGYWQSSPSLDRLRNSTEHTLGLSFCIRQICWQIIAIVSR